ncbi:unnamed protein product [Rangifer tarandus platyrhynchus]|uniref:Uncharacterized protein n=1 Tax=Rangifer tarandus platyrhynchus TaxID=3082113 RepID=A0AC59ZE50_RANTA
MTAGRVTEQRPNGMAVYSGPDQLPPFRLPLWITTGMRGQRSPRHEEGDFLVAKVGDTIEHRRHQGTKLDTERELVAKAG